MIQNITEFKNIKKRMLYNRMVENQLKKQKKIKNFVNKANKENQLFYNFGIDRVYNISILHNKIDWFKYYFECYIVEYLQQIQNIKNNKI